MPLLLLLLLFPSLLHAAPLTFGSQPLLEACWGAAELSGTAAERRSRRRSGDGGGDVRAEAAEEDAAPALSPLPAALHGSIRRVEPVGDDRPIALTFDLCQGAGEVSGYDAPLVDWLRAHRIKATFFAGGEWLRDHRERALQLLADPLFELGHHGWDHANLRLAPAAVAAQLERTAAQYALLRRELLARPCAAGAAGAEAAALPAAMTLLRFPYGACDGRGMAAAAAAGVASIQWQVVTGDPAPGRDAAAIAATVLREARPGAIVVAHANGRGRHSAEALPLLVPALAARGYRFVTVSELLAAGRPVAAGQCYEEVPGDNLKYDRPPGHREPPP